MEGERLVTSRQARPLRQRAYYRNRLGTAPAVQFGVLVVRTTGGWARISVDGVFRREGSSHRDSLPAGPHTLRLERAGYVTIDTTVTLQAGETRLVTIAMRQGNP